jgi:hypothetical protein
MKKYNWFVSIVGGIVFAFAIGIVVQACAPSPDYFKDVGEYVGHMDGQNLYKYVDVNTTCYEYANSLSCVVTK